MCEQVDAAQKVLSRAPTLAFAQVQRARGELLPMVEAYAALKRERGVIDYSDQVALAAQLARDSDEVVAVEQARWGAVLLDEYQDTGESQRVLLTSLFGGGRCVTAVGDPRQSIYGWRGASAGNLQRFGADFGGNRESGLTQSFRNGEAILTVANAVAAGPARRRARAAPARPRPRPGRHRCRSSAHSSRRSPRRPRSWPTGWSRRTTVVSPGARWPS